jgi:hypothetical protein
MRTIRNCPSRAGVECPGNWDCLISDESPTVRQCDRCAQLVYLCTTDEETAACAKAGRLIARAMPTAAELGTVFTEIAPGLAFLWLGCHPRLSRPRIASVGRESMRLIMRSRPSGGHLVIAPGADTRFRTIGGLTLSAACGSVGSKESPEPAQ